MVIDGCNTERDDVLLEMPLIGVTLGGGRREEACRRSCSVSKNVHLSRNLIHAPIVNLYSEYSHVP